MCYGTQACVSKATQTETVNSFEIFPCIEEMAFSHRFHFSTDFATLSHSIYYYRAVLEAKESHSRKTNNLFRGKSGWGCHLPLTSDLCFHGNTYVTDLDEKLRIEKGNMRRDWGGKRQCPQAGKPNPVLLLPACEANARQ